MPKGPFGLPRLSNIDPFTELTRDEKIEKVLQEFSTKVVVTKDSIGSRFKYRIDIANGSDITVDDEIRDTLPTAQNIPSDMGVRGDRAEGTIRPPNIDKRSISEDEFKKRMGDVITGEAEIILQSGQSVYRPHIVIERTSISDYIQTVAEVHDNFVDVIMDD